jgi:hypothetical protein
MPYRLGDIRKRANYKGIPFDLDGEWIKTKVINGVCESTNIPFVLEPNISSINPFIPSIDRVDSNKGYTKDNCRIVIYGFNSMKSIHDDATLIKFCKGFIKQYEKENNI